MSRQNRLLFGASRRVPWVTNVPMWLMALGARRFADRFLSVMMRALPEPDKAILSRPEIRPLFVQDAVEAFRSGGRGAAWEAVLYARPWGFRLEDITMEVHLWQGEMDVNVPPTMGRYQADAIPNCKATFSPEEGHLLLIDRMEEILSSLVS
jgi:pimeloyl-ACP methyl ester carboxylesterase